MHGTSTFSIGSCSEQGGCASFLFRWSMTELQEFLRHDCSLDDLLHAIEWKYSQLGTVRERAATAYLTNAAKYGEGKPPRGEGLREFAKAYGITTSALVYQIAHME